jgi:hypothetical protein
MLPLIILIGVLVAIPTVALMITTFKLISLLGVTKYGVAENVSPFFHANKSETLEKELQEVLYRLDACYDRIAYLEDAVPMPDQRPTEDIEVPDQEYFFDENENTSKHQQELEERIGWMHERIMGLEMELYDARGTSDQRPTEDIEVPDQEYFFDENELYGTPEELINPELVEKNRLHDEKINRIKEELAMAQAGVIYNVDHDEVDKRYQPKPIHEYTE